jgi:hypothetical protein
MRTKEKRDKGLKTQAESRLFKGKELSYSSVYEYPLHALNDAIYLFHMTHESKRFNKKRTRKKIHLNQEN